MPINYAEGGDFEKLPRVGEDPKEFEIKHCTKVENPNFKYNFTKKEPRKLDDGTEVKVDVNQGYHYNFELENGKSFIISSWKPFFAFKEANVQDGDHIKVFHPAEGEWKVELIKRNPGGYVMESPDDPTLEESEEAWDGDK